MSRPLRIEYPGAFYHIISRGNARQKIFKTKRAYETYIENAYSLSGIEKYIKLDNFTVSRIIKKLINAENKP